MVHCTIKATGLWFASCVLFVTSVQAEAIAIYNTGVDNSGTVLPLGSVDPHFQLTVSPDPSSTAYVTVPYPNWVSSTTARWLAPYQNSTNAFTAPAAGGDYTYRTTFDLTGFIPATAQLSGRWATDNAGVDIFLNGISTGNQLPFGSGPFSYEVLTSFVISNGFVPGVNTLDFSVNNFIDSSGSPNPTGLIVEIAGSADRVPVPEPGSAELVFMTAVSFAAVYLAQRRRKCRT
jgi:hypothetical protein